MPSQVTAIRQSKVDAVAFDFHRNLAKLEELLIGFLDGLRTTTLRDLHLRTAAAYGPASAARGLDHFLGYTKRCTSRHTAARFARSAICTERRSANQDDSFRRTQPTRGSWVTDARRRPMEAPASC